MAPPGSWRWLFFALGALVAAAGSSGCCGLSHRYHESGDGCPACDRCLSAGEDYSHAPGGCLHCRHGLGGHGLLHRGDEMGSEMMPSEEAPFVPPVARYHPVPARPVFEPR